MHITKAIPCAASAPRNPLPCRLGQPFAVRWLQRRYSLTESSARVVAHLAGLKAAR
jgi:hypothetical protein